MNVGASSGVQYTLGDFAKQWSFSPILNGTQLQTSEKIGETSSVRSKTTQQVLPCGLNLCNSTDYCVSYEICDFSFLLNLFWSRPKL